MIEALLSTIDKIPLHRFYLPGFDGEGPNAVDARIARKPQQNSTTAKRLHVFDPERCVQPAYNFSVDVCARGNDVLTGHVSLATRFLFLH